jgi:hypothetical protein
MILLRFNGALGRRMIQAVMPGASRRHSSFMSSLANRILNISRKNQ